MNTEDYQDFFMQSSALKVAVDTEFTVINASNGFLNATQNERDNIVGQYIFDVFPKISNDIGVIFINAMRDSFNKVLKDKVVNTSDVVRYQNTDGEVRYWKVVNTPIFNDDGEVRFISQRFIDVTDSRKLTEQLKVEKQNLDEYKTALEYIENAVSQAPAPVCILRGPEHIVELTNKEFMRIVPDKDIYGKPAREAMPEMEGQGFFKILDRVYTTESTYVGSEVPATFKMGRKDVDVYIDFVYQIMYDTDGKKSGIFVMGNDVTNQVLARKKVVESEDRYRTLIEESTVATALFKGSDIIVEYANDKMLDIWDKDSIVIGQPIRKILPELENQPFFGYVDNVYKTGKTYTGIEEQVILEVDGELQTFYYNFTFKALRNRNGEIYGIHHVAIDVTEQVLARKKAEESEYRYRTLIEESPVATALFLGPDSIVQYANDKMLNFWNRDKLLFGQSIRETLPELETKSFFDYFDKVYKTGETYTGVEEKAILKVDGEPQTYYINLTLKALRDNEGEIYGILKVAVDVTKQVFARKNAEESEYRYRTLIEESTVAIALLNGPDLVLQFANDKMLDYWGRNKSIFGQPISKTLPELENQPFLDYLDNVFETGETYTGVEEKAILKVDGELQTFFFNFTYKALSDRNGRIYGIQIIAIDVSEQVLDRNKAEESEYRYRTLIEESPVATALYEGPDFVLQYANDEMLDFWNKDKSNFGQPLRKILPELEDQPFFDYLEKVYETGETYNGVEEKTKIIVEDELRTFFFDFTYKALLNSDGEIYGILNIAIDVTEQVYAKKALEENQEFLNQLLNSMPQKVSHTDENGYLVFFNQQWMDETGYSLEELQNNGWIKTLHPDDLPALRREWVHALKTASVFEVESRIYHKDLGYRWNLNRALPVKNENGEILMWVGSNTDIHEQKKHEETLEKAVRERTKELEKANEELVFQNQEMEKQTKELEMANKELESFAYISSHDLQEPLRKIQIFIGRITDKELLDDKGEYYFDRIRDAADRMRILIEDILYFSRVNNTEKIFEEVDLNDVIEDAKKDYKDEIREKKAIIEIGEICKVNVISFQFRQLMKNLLSNALKFAKPGRPLLITINSVITKGIEHNVENLHPKKEYCHILFMDNGIGFESEYNKRIFDVFQRLHSKDDFSGTGIGLAIVKKIVDNHNGVITAAGIPDEGARFDIYLPVKQEDIT